MILRFYEKATFRDIAKLHGKSEEACRKRVYRALEKLASLLRKRGVLIPPATLGIGMGACLTRDALPMASGAIAKLALASPPAAETSILANILIAMSNYKLTLVTATAAALIPIGLQWQANHAQAISAEPSITGNGLSHMLLNEATPPTSVEAITAG